MEIFLWITLAVLVVIGFKLAIGFCTINDDFEADQHAASIRDAIRDVTPLGMTDWLLAQERIPRLVKLCCPADGHPSDSGWLEISDTRRYDEACWLAEWLEDRGIVEISDEGYWRIVPGEWAQLAEGSR